MPRSPEPMSSASRIIILGGSPSVVSLLKKKSVISNYVYDIKCIIDGLHRPPTCPLVVGCCLSQAEKEIIVC